MKKILIFLFLLLNLSAVLCQETSDPEELNKKGIEFYKQGNYVEAVKYFDKALKIDDKGAPIWNNKGMALLQIKEQEEEAIKCFDKAVVLDPLYVKAWYNKGLALFNLKKYDSAILCFDKVLSLEPQHKEAKTKKQEIQSIQKSEKSVETLINDGIKFYNQKNYDEAFKCFDKATTLGPENDTAWVKKGQTLAKKEKYDDAIKCYDKALVINQKNLEALYGKGDALFAQGKYKEALECYNKILVIKPDEKNAKNKKDEVEKAFAAKQKPTAEELFQQGETCFKEKKPDEAIKYYDKALEIDPNHIQSLFGKGIILIFTDKKQEGYEYMDKVLAIDPEFEKAWDVKGDLLAEAGQYDKALDCYRRVFELKADFTNIQFKIQEMEKALSGQANVPVDSDPCRDLYNKGSVLYKEGKFNESLGMFQQALDINPRYVPVLFKKGLILALISYGKDKRKMKESAECFADVYSLDPELKQCDINGTDNMGTTPLQIALMRKALVIARLPELLIDKGADVNAKNNDGNTALHEAARFGYLEIVRKILDKGADVNMENNDGFTPLHSASASGFVKVAELLIEKGAKVNAKSKNGRTPLAVAGGNSAMKDLLRANGAKE